MTFELVVLGCSGSGPAPGAPASGYLIRSSSTALWLDAGTGTFMRLADVIDPRDLAGVAISHFHADHSADFFGFFHYVAYRNPPESPIPVFVPPGGIDKAASFLEAGADHALWQVLALEEVGDGAVREIGDLTIRFASTVHSVPTNAVRVEHHGRSLVFSGDTGLGGGFPALAAGADVVLCEAALAGDRSNGAYAHHLSGAEAGAIAQQAGAERLILTHLAPSLPVDEIVRSAATAFAGSTELAYPGLHSAI